MKLHNLAIKQKLMLIIVFTSAVVLLLTAVAFATYNWFAFRAGLARSITTLSAVISDNSSAALAFRNADDATQILGALKADRNVVAAALYDAEGKLFAAYPADAPAKQFPVTPGPEGYHFESRGLISFYP